MSERFVPSWRRPSGPLNVWKIIERKMKIFDDEEQLIRISFQEVPEHRRDEAIDHMLQYFASDESINWCNNNADDQQIIQDLKVFWNYCLDQGIVLAAYKVNSQNEISELIGVNMILVISEQTEEDLRHLSQKCQSVRFPDILRIRNGVMKKANIYQLFGVDKYISTIGLGIKTEYRGQKFGLEMLKIRTDVGKTYGIKVSSSIFSTRPSQVLAQRAGFEDVLNERQDNFLDDQGRPLFPNAGSERVKCMAKRLI
ncbi:hypothetical protein QAD02_004141 [Eretmocerus hayati]|uniref:Uncharacterized protein n=1 Tax=Eretmocerus hayati TaxID=131215 RepID=A0ACC2NNP0_9HYME|nr:hypothetical protein QAD02_004141 [Eretmocerus hayati]